MRTNIRRLQQICAVGHGCCLVNNGALRWRKRRRKKKKKKKEMVGEGARWWVVAGRMLTHPCRLDISDDGQGGVVRAFLLHCSSTSKCRTCCCKWLL
jgi:hypothetical protein